MPETVEHPAHYQGCTPETRAIVSLFIDRELLDRECIEALEESDIRCFCLGNAIKYLWRCGQKGDSGDAVVEDLKKARWYFERSRKWARLEGRLLWFDATASAIYMIDERLEAVPNAD